MSDSRTNRTRREARRAKAALQAQAATPATREPYYMHAVDCAAHASNVAPCTKRCAARLAAAEGRA